MLPLSKKLAKEFRKHCMEHGSCFFKEKIQKLIECSLEESTTTQIISVSSQIAVYQALQKLLQWTDRNLNEEIFHQELKIKVAKRMKELNEDSNDKKEFLEITIEIEGEESHLILHNILSLMKNLITNLLRSNCDSIKAENSIRELFVQIKEYFLSKVNMIFI